MSDVYAWIEINELEGDERIEAMRFLIDLDRLWLKDYVKKSKRKKDKKKGGK